MAAQTQNLSVVTSAIMPALLWSDITDGDDSLLQAFPPGYEDADKVQYHQYDSPFGVFPLRGLNGSPPMVQFGGYRVYELDPGYFGGETQINEAEITSGVQPGTLHEPLKVGDRLGKLMLDFATMIVSRFRATLADLLADGTVRITDAHGNVFQFTIPGYRTYTPGTGWGASPSSAKPIANLLAQKATLQRGTSTKFGKDSKLLMNSATLAEYYATAEVQSTYKLKYGSSPIGLEGVNELHQGFDLPKIEVYDHGYFPTLADAKNRTYANWTYVLPTRTVLWLGARPGQKQLGQFQLTRHAGIVCESDANKIPSVSVENQGKAEIAKGLFVRAKYRDMMPNGYDLQIGFNGCPMLWYDDSACGITTG